MSLNKKKKDLQVPGFGEEVKSSQLWLPPASVLAHVAQIITLQIEYMLTIGEPEASLPDFLSKGCLRKTNTGQIKYNFGPDAYYNEATIQPDKRPCDHTPLKGQRRK